jgi:hypothetical protein
MKHSAWGNSTEQYCKISSKRTRHSHGSENGLRLIAQKQNIIFMQLKAFLFRGSQKHGEMDITVISKTSIEDENITLCTI